MKIRIFVYAALFLSLHSLSFAHLSESDLKKLCKSATQNVRLKPSYTSEIQNLMNETEIAMENYSAISWPEFRMPIELNSGASTNDKKDAVNVLNLLRMPTFPELITECKELSELNRLTKLREVTFQKELEKRQNLYQEK